MTVPLHGYPDWQGPLATADQSAFTQTSTLNPTEGLDTGAIDMRPYQSYSVRVAVATNGAATGFGEMVLIAKWIDDAAAASARFRENWSIFPFAATGGAFDCPYDQFQNQDNVHGPFLQFFVFNFGPDQVSAEIDLLGHTRQIPGPYTRHSGLVGTGPTNADDPLLIGESTAIAAATTVNRVLRLAPGRIWLRLSAVAVAIQFDFLYANGYFFETYTVAAGTVTRAELILPHQEVRMRIINAAALPGTWGAAINQERRTW